MRIAVTLVCAECKRKNYQTSKNKNTTTNKLELKKYCRACRGHKPHKEAK